MTLAEITANSTDIEDVEPKSVTAFVQARPATNLLTDPKHMLPSQQQRTGFLGVFNKKYAGDPRKSLMKVAFGAFLDARTIPLGRIPKPTDEAGATALKTSKKKLSDWERLREKDFHKYTKLRKVNSPEPQIILNLPMFIAGNAYSFAMVFSLFSTVPIPPDTMEHLTAMLDNAADGTQLFPAKLALGNAAVGPDLAAMLEKCLLGVRLDSRDKQGLVSLEFVISQSEAEHLVGMDWIEIRPVDMYPLLSNWAAAEYFPKRYGKSAVSISKIASTLPAIAPDDTRVDKYGIAISPSGAPIYLPPNLDNSGKYESLFSSAGNNPDGSFSLFNPGADVNKAKKLPANIPVLVDWLNFKFSYSNSAGRIEVLPLEHFRKCTASMAVNVIRSSAISVTLIKTLCRYASLAGVSVTLTDYMRAGESDFDTAEGTDPYSFFRKRIGVLANTVPDALLALETGIENGSIQAKYAPSAIDFTDGAPKLFAFINRFIVALHDGMVNNLDALYTQYAVSTVTYHLGYIALLANYGRDFTNTTLEANTKNQAALEQGVTPGWTPESLPLLTKKFQDENGGLLPHQYKVRNMMKGRPDLAIIPVQAGGGKSMLAITDVLGEIKAGESFPYLIMCPSHLVANYVSEIVEFTDGTVNVLPITSYNIRTTGYARYEQVIEKAPINTVFVVDYNALKFRARPTVYGTSPVLVYPVVELLRKFRPGYVFLDESHFLKNANSTRYHSVMSLVADIPKKRIASGTLNADSPSDLPGQVAILDPTIFGTRDDFNMEFGNKLSGNRVVEWKPNAGEVAIQRIKQNAVWAPARRKEWACALPPRSDHFVYVSLSDAQRVVYDAIFDDMVQSIRKKAESDKNAKRLLDSLNGKKTNKATQEDEDDFANINDVPKDSEEDLEEEENDIGSSLQPYLAAIEMFVSDPSSHPYATNGFVTEDGVRVPPLTGDDLKSPKAAALAHQLTEWFAGNKTKAIVFVNYHNSATAMFEAMPPELKACGFVYKASQKVEMVNRFKTDPKVKWMIGIRQSLEVGLNLQIAGYLARIEGVWTPAEQEQGDSRIERPFFGKGGDQRPGLRFDTIVADRTIDVTKAARLRAKIIANAKFDNPTDPNYQEIPNIPVFSMTLENITTQNDFATNLAQYQTSIAMLNQVIKNENEEYRKKLIETGGFKFTQIERAPNPPEAKILSRVPYAQGTELYSAADLGLVRLDNFLGTEMAAEEDDEDEESNEDMSLNDTRAESLRQQLATIIGLRCHTEYGEGEIVTGAAGGGSFISRVQVLLDDGTMVRGLHSTNVFVITRTETNGIDMRSALAKAAGLTQTESITVPGNNLLTKLTRKAQRQLDEKLEEEQRKREEERKRNKGKATQMKLILNLSILNGYLRVSYSGGDTKAAKALEALGFRADNKYVYTRIQSYKHLINQAKVWADAGFTTTKQVNNDTFRMLAAEFATNSLKTHKHYVRVVGSGFQNYLRTNFKPSSDKEALAMFALVTDGGEYQGKADSYGMAFLCLPHGSGYPATREAIKNEYRRPATKWIISDDSLSVYVANLDAVKRVFRELKDAGIQISNIKDLETQAKSVKKIKPKDDETIDLK